MLNERHVSLSFLNMLCFYLWKTHACKCVEKGRDWLKCLCCSLDHYVLGDQENNQLTVLSNMHDPR